jgi:hypothetical protein
MRRSDGYSRDPCIELLRPEDSATAKAAANIKYVTAWNRLHAPDVGQIVQHPFLRGD